MESILHYFPNLTAEQVAQFEGLDALYREWNEKINVISRKDIDSLYLHHVLHSLAIAKVVAFKSGSTVVDLGTGGGFPGVPLAILFPETQFILSDSIGKKVVVAQAVADGIGLRNVQTVHGRSEQLKVKADFVVSRAVAPLGQLMLWARPIIAKKHQNALPNGLICLKGGNLKAEIAELGKEKRYVDTYTIKDYFKQEFFDEKSVLYVPI